MSVTFPHPAYFTLAGQVDAISAAVAAEAKRNASAKAQSETARQRQLDASAARKAAQAQAVEQALADNGAPMRISQIMDATDLSNTPVRAAVKALMADGKVSVACGPVPGSSAPAPYYSLTKGKEA